MLLLYVFITVSLDKYKRDVNNLGGHYEKENNLTHANQMHKNYMESFTCTIGP